MKSWPASLPQYVSKSGFQSGMGDGRVRSDTDAGIAKVRRRFSYVPIPLAVTMKLTQDQLETLKSFVSDDLSGGTLPFRFPVASFSNTTDTWTMRLGRNMPTWSPVGLKWLVTLDLVILP